MEILPHDKIYHRDLSNLSGLVQKREDSSLYYVDPFVPWEDLIHSNNFNRVMVEYYDLTSEQVWNLLHGFDKDEKHYCNHCGGEVQFRKLSFGYPLYCCPSCSSSEIMSNLNRQWWSGNRDNPYINSIEQFAYIEYCHERNVNLEVSYINRWLYVILLESSMFKIGIIQDGDLESVKRYLNSKYSNFSIHSLYYDDKDKVVDTEYEIKIENKDHRILERGERGWTETFSVEYLLDTLNLIKLNPYVMNVQRLEQGR